MVHALHDYNKACLTRRQFLAWFFGALAVGRGVSVSQAKAAASGFGVWWVPLALGTVHHWGQYKAPLAGRPGSISKLVTAAALLETALISPEQRYACEGVYSHGRHRIVCPHAHGTVTLVTALGQSCNGYFAQAVRPMALTQWVDYARRFGLSDAAAGITPVAFKVDPKDELVLLALGLSGAVVPTAYHLLQLAGCVAQQDLSYRLLPWSDAASVSQVNLSPLTWQLLGQGMRQAARMGTGKVLDPSDTHRLALKTGTVPYGTGFQSWAIGFFPFEAPTVSFCVRALQGTSQEAAIPAAGRWLRTRGWQ